MCTFTLVCSHSTIFSLFLHVHILQTRPCGAFAHSYLRLHANSCSRPLPLPLPPLSPAPAFVICVLASNPLYSTSPITLHPARIITPTLHCAVNRKIQPAPFLLVLLLSLISPCRYPVTDASCITHTHTHTPHSPHHHLPLTPITIPPRLYLHLNYRTYELYVFPPFPIITQHVPPLPADISPCTTTPSTAPPALPRHNAVSPEASKNTCRTAFLYCYWALSTHSQPSFVYHSDQSMARSRYLPSSLFALSFTPHIHIATRPFAAPITAARLYRQHSTTEGYLFNMPNFI